MPALKIGPSRAMKPTPELRFVRRTSEPVKCLGTNILSAEQPPVRLILQQKWESGTVEDGVSLPYIEEWRDVPLVEEA